jgi:hypothetical protein
VAKVQLTATLVALDPSHQRLWLVAGNILKQGKKHERVCATHKCMY